MDEQKVLEENPGDPVFSTYAASLRKEGNLLGAMDICLAGLTYNPGHHQGRLELARIYYELGYIPFAKAEVEDLLKILPEMTSLKKLYERITGEDYVASEAEEVDSPVEEETVTEVDIDIDVFDE